MSLRKTTSMSAFSTDQMPRSISFFSSPGRQPT
jgi:hypothetical protein